MDGFDGECHLRLIGERSLVSGEFQDSLGDPLTGQARALAAVGAVALPVARRVVDDYARARALRGLGGPAHDGPRAAAAPGPRHRIAAGRRVIKQPTGDLEIRYAILSPTETRLALTFRSGARLSPDAARRPAGMPAGISTVPSISVTDDRGTTVTSSAFSGGGTAGQWRGFLTLRPALAPDTGWIELYGERIPLGPDVSDRAVTIENFTAADAVERYLAQCLAVDSAQPRPRAMAHALAALRAAGLVDATDPAIVTIAAVYNGLIPHAGPYLLPATLPAGHWRSLLARRGTTGGPRRALFVGATTPVFDRISATLLDLTSTDDRFQCDFEIAGPIELGLTGDGDLDRTSVTFSALDDVGNYYLGQVGTWGGDGSTFSGALDFWPALDPRAKALDLMLTTDWARATIAVPLTWDAAP